MTALIRRSALPLGASAHIERRRPVAADPLENVRLFATGWAGGMIFFTTFFS